MNKGLIVAALAAVAAYAAERLFASMSEDIKRYDEMRKMSGQETLVKELLSMLGGSLSKDGPTGLIASLTSDAVRYANLKGM